MATTTANAYVNAEVRASGALMFPTDYIQVAKKTSRYALMQFSIPNLTDVSISSAKLRFYILKTASLPLRGEWIEMLLNSAFSFTG